MSWRLLVAVVALLPSLGNCEANASPSVSISAEAQHWIRIPSPAVDSQETPPTARVPPFDRSRVGVWYGHSTVAGGILGKIQNTGIRLVGIRFRHPLIPKHKGDRKGYDGPTLLYTADVIPFASAHIPRGGAQTFVGVPSPEVSTQGVGLYPVGLEIGFRRPRTVKPFVSGHTGFIYFSEPLPDERGKQLNFAVGIGGGVQVALPGPFAFSVEYRYHHLSNGFRGSINPGLDANVLYLGFDVAL